MANLRSIALHRCRCVIPLLFVRAAGAAESTPLPIQSEDSEFLDPGLWRVILALAVVAGIILFLQWMMRRGKKGAPLHLGGRSKIQILDRKAIAPRQWLLVVKVGKQGVLLHQGKGAVVPLREIDLEDEEATP